MTDGRIWDTGEEARLPLEWHGCDGDDCPAYKAIREIKHPIFGAGGMSYHDLAHQVVALERENERLKGIIEQSKPREGILPPLEWEP